MRLILNGTDSMSVAPGAPATAYAAAHDVFVKEIAFRTDCHKKSWPAALIIELMLAEAVMRMSNRKGDGRHAHHLYCSIINPAHREPMQKLKNRVMKLRELQR